MHALYGAYRRMLHASALRCGRTQRLFDGMGSKELAVALFGSDKFIHPDKSRFAVLTKHPKGWHVAGRIREHIQTEYSMNLQKKTAELKALQAQIHPHFLQNTLQMIGSMVFSQKPEDTYEVIRSLSEMFRYVVREPQDMASLRAELDHAGHYMRIQQRRFPQRLVFQVEVDERAMDIRLPKLSLQPLLENAFQHGLERKAGAWRMGIRVEIRKEDVCITVCDNGNGMDADKLEKVRAKLENALEESTGRRGVISD